jgi:hypothetical protein
MPSIDTLADDIKDMFGSNALANDELLASFGGRVALHVMDSLKARDGVRKPKSLYMSEVGKPCLRQIWYSVNHPGLAEEMPKHAHFKFLYGDVIEEVALLLAEAAGHEVTKRQERSEWLTKNGWTISGRLDAVIDGVLVDVKSCSPFGYKKFQEGLNDSNDSFGYRAQLSSYNGGLYERQGILAIDKQNGHVGFFDVPYEDPSKRMEEVAIACADPFTEPRRQFALKPEGTSGNLKLGVECSYCPYKQACWRDANDGEGLKAYAYSTGPVFLGTVRKEPRTPQLYLLPLSLSGLPDLTPSHEIHPVTHRGVSHAGTAT